MCCSEFIECTICAGREDTLHSALCLSRSGFRGSVVCVELLKGVFYFRTLLVSTSCVRVVSPVSHILQYRGHRFLNSAVLGVFIPEACKGMQPATMNRQAQILTCFGISVPGVLLVFMYRTSCTWYLYFMYFWYFGTWCVSAHVHVQLLLIFA